MKGSKNGSFSEGSQQGDSENDDDSSGLEKDIELLHNRICEFEIYLMQMDKVVGALQKERDKMDQENIELQKENERFHQEVKFEKIHNADLKNELKKTRRKRITGNIETENQLRGSGILGVVHPLSIMKSVIHRILLFTWWSGFWFYEGLSIFGWENKWAKMEKKKKRLEEENGEIEHEVARLKKYIAEQQRELVSQKHTNFELLNQLTECVDVNNRKIMVLEEIWKKVEDYTNILEDHFEDLKKLERQKHRALPQDSGEHIGTTGDTMDDNGTSSPNIPLGKRRLAQDNEGHIGTTGDTMDDNGTSSPNIPLGKRRLAQDNEGHIGTTGDSTDDEGTSGDHTGSPNKSFRKRRRVEQDNSEDDDIMSLFNVRYLLMFFVLVVIYFMIPP